MVDREREAEDVIAPPSVKISEGSKDQSSVQSHEGSLDEVQSRARLTDPLDRKQDAASHLSRTPR